MASIQKPQNNYNRIIIHLSASARYWRWQAREHGRVIASGSGTLPRDCSLLEATNFAKIKAMEWQDKNNCLDARMVIEQPLNPDERRAA